MSRANQAPADARQSPRLKLPAMYTLVRAKPVGEERYCWTGYIYDISASGMRFELDAALSPGTQLEFRAMLPGADQTTVRALGRVVRQHDELHEPGPVRMGLTFERFAHHTDRRKLWSYLQHAGLKAA